MKLILLGRGMQPFLRFCFYGANFKKSESR